MVFGGFVAAGMPILGAVASIAGALASLLAFSYVIDLDATVVNVVTVLGLGLCIDYGLLTVSRFREELRARAQGMPARDIPREMVIDAAARTVDSAGRTVIFSGLTVAISLGGLLVFEAPIMRAIGAAALSVVLVAILVARHPDPGPGRHGRAPPAEEGHRAGPRARRLLTARRVGRTTAPSPSSSGSWPCSSSSPCPRSTCA